MNYDLLIENTVRQVLMEYSGVSDEVTDMSSEIMSLIINTSKKIEWEFDNRSSMNLKSFYLDLRDTKVSNIMPNVVVYVELYGYDSSSNTFFEVKELLDSKGRLKWAYSSKYNRISLNMPFPFDGNLDENSYSYILSSINHEVKHAYQANKGKDLSPNDFYMNSITKKYNLDVDVNDRNKLFETLIKYHIKDAYYMLDIDEVNAFLQELYIELKQFGDLNQCKTYNKMKEAINGYRQFVKHVAIPINSIQKDFYNEFTERFDDILKNELGNGITTQQMIRHCEKGIKLFNSGLRRIIARYNQEQGKTPNGSFKQYASNEIPREEIVWLIKNKPSLWKRIINKLKKR